MGWADGDRYAWECVCGHLNWGSAGPGSVCAGCRTQLTSYRQVEAQYRLDPITITFRPRGPKAPRT